ncbi:hypothetical protein [Streptomyces boncukensis]|uniref:Uncharacterized protein n=1 Tax=Streptomyces boncukensis TaxID=2711219 RepID=A0A6G4WWG8_9ACTN|nr:hypothetical protein [Streptomyces boncukensis]NGO68947.1 hypothetical protein [Streptomyces boncukensis]
MPSVGGLLEQHELAARRRVDELREEVDRIQAELAAAEQEWAIARGWVETVLAPDSGTTAGTEAADRPWDAETLSAHREAAKPKSQVPVWHQGLAWTALSADYQRILKVLAARARLGQGPLTCQEMAASFGMDVVLARVALRSKAKRLVARGRLAEPAAGRFTFARGVSGSDGGS